VTAVALTQRTARFRRPRALRLEIKHSAVVWVLPILAVLFYFDAYRAAAGLPPTWTLQASVITGTIVIFFCVFAAGIAAWVATREGRRKTGDLLATTARAGWARQATMLAATAFWMVLAYLAGVAAIYIPAARQATWGSPPLWPVAAGVAAIAAACAVGFVGGTLFPGRFTAPIVAVAVFVLCFIGVNAANPLLNAAANPLLNASNGMKGTSALLLPASARPQIVEAGLFYRISPDVSIARVMFMGGVLLVMFGLLALSPVPRLPGVRGLSFAATGRLAVLAAVVVAGGVAASATAFALTGTARYSATTGWVIPALHDAADDQPIPYTQDCTGGAFAVCIHPALDAYLDAISGALQPAAAEIAGLPGAPVRAELAVGGAFPAAAGTTSVYAYSGIGGVDQSSFMETPAEAHTAVWEQGIQEEFLSWFVSGPQQADQQAGPDAAQQAVADALLAKLGVLAPQSGPVGSFSGSASAQGSGTASGSQPAASPAQISAAASTFESLSSAARHAWLAANIAALRSGTITLAQLP
jgi:ABC-type transport system involved in multi-copper enzyme maturation permease subunit